MRRKKNKVKELEKKNYNDYNSQTGQLYIQNIQKETVKLLELVDELSRSMDIKSIYLPNFSHYRHKHQGPERCPFLYKYFQNEKTSDSQSSAPAFFNRYASAI